MNSYDLVIISRSVPSGNYQDAGATAWNSVTAPMLVMGGYPMRSSRMGFVTGTGLADTIDAITLTANDPNHPVFAGIPLDVNDVMQSPFAGVVTYNDIVQLGVSVTLDPLAAGGKMLGTVATATDPAVGGTVIGEWLAGATMGNGAADILSGHRLSFLSGSRESGITSEAAGIFDLSGTGTAMFLNAVEYMLIPPDITRPGDAIVPSSSNHPAAEPAPAAIDDDSTTKYLNFDAEGGTNDVGFVVTPALGSTVVTGMSLQSANDAPERDPMTVALEGSGAAAAPAWDDATAWTPIVQIDVPAFADRFTWQTFVFNNTAAYKHYRWVVSAVADVTTANSMQIAEVGLLGSVLMAEGPVIDSVTREGDTVTATWTGGGEAEVAETIEGPWTATGNTTGSITFDVTAAPGGFLRIRGN
jgi:hypothetical protein